MEENNTEIKWHAMPAEEVIEKLETSLTDGLNSNE
jgi:hypothetical protein